ncbi:helix-turn-helix domain-containing protein [Nocardioides ungokensis]|uniref:helix-turn-helix domain-containing protein n=1 Tax=Nocardioides ungokensis TaxID=1643322 RepID=UPI0015E05210|nr:helix-turn-helix transcriptional regulator [Nocardioides ungokensis]
MGDILAFPTPPRAPEHRVPETRLPEPHLPEPHLPEPLWRDAVGRELRGERRQQGRTLQDVAGEAGVSTQYLSEVERGRKEPSSEVLGAVAGALGLRLVDLTSRVSRSLGSVDGPVCLAA